MQLATRDLRGCIGRAGVLSSDTDACHQVYLESDISCLPVLTECPSSCIGSLRCRNLAVMRFNVSLATAGLCTPSCMVTPRDMLSQRWTIEELHHWEADRRDNPDCSLYQSVRHQQDRQVVYPHCLPRAPCCYLLGTSNIGRKDPSGNISPSTRMLHPHKLLNLWVTCGI